MGWYRSRPGWQRILLTVVALWFVATVLSAVFMEAWAAASGGTIHGHRSNIVIHGGKS